MSLNKICDELNKKYECDLEGELRDDEVWFYERKSGKKGRFSDIESIDVFLEKKEYYISCLIKYFNLKELFENIYMKIMKHNKLKEKR